MRSQNWQIDMGKAIEKAEATPFAWGSNDCCLFVCDVILAMTGVDLGADFRGKYDTREGAEALIGFATDGGDLELFVEQMCRQNHMPEVEVNFAWRGDVALHDADAGPCLGIIDGDGAVYLSEKHRLLMIPRGDIRRTWRV